jgi:hypothetical protein
MLIEFIVDLTMRNWENLKTVILSKLRGFKEKIETIL